MAEKKPRETKNLDQYGNEALPWRRALTALEGGSSELDVPWFLGVTDPDGSPHSTGIGALWSEGELFFVSGPGTRKSKDLDARPAASLSTRLKGIDLVFEGTARRIVDGPTLDRVVKLYRDSGWPAEVAGDAFTAPFTAPSGGPPPWYLYTLDYRDVYGVGTADPSGASRWSF